MSAGANSVTSSGVKRYTYVAISLYISICRHSPMSKKCSKILNFGAFNYKSDVIQ